MLNKAFPIKKIVCVQGMPLWMYIKSAIKKENWH